MTNSNGKLLCGHLMPTEYADYVTFVYLAMYMYGVVTSLYVYVMGRRGTVMGRRGQ